MPRVRGALWDRWIQRLVKEIWEGLGLYMSIFDHNFGKFVATVRQREHTCPNTVGSEEQEGETRGRPTSLVLGFARSSSANLRKTSESISTGSSVTSNPSLDVDLLGSSRVLKFLCHDIGPGLMV